MKILGLSSNYHDSSASLVVDGKVVASSAEERFTREKHDPSFPSFSVQFCLEQAKIKSDEIDFVAYHEDPLIKFSRNLSATLLNWPKSSKTFIHAMKEAVTSGFWIRHEIAKKLDIHPRKVVYIPHHVSHAAHTFLTSPFDKAAVLTLDAVGEWISTAFFSADLSRSKNKVIEPLEVVSFPNSLGLVYSAFTGYLGFKVNSGESSTMALAAFGQPRYLNEIRKIIKIVDNGTYEVDLSYFDFSQVDSLPITQKFLDTFGPPRAFKSKLPFDCLSTQTITPSDEDKRFADIACSIQTVLEETTLHLLKRLRKITDTDNLCLAGGVALNCVANAAIIKSGIFKNVYCPPDPGDGGGAMGAALYLSFIKEKSFSKTALTTYLGAEHSADDLEKMLFHLDPADWHRYTKLAVKPLSKDKLRFQRFSSKEELVKKTAQLLFEKKIVGWSQGRFENGPRALGARSILIDPSDYELAKKLSQSVKVRAPFRPYACSFTEEAARECLEFHEGKEPLLAKWMLCALPVKKSVLHKLQAAVHVDNTTRAQIVRSEDNKLFYDLLKEFGKLKGVGALLNTSFNEAGYPIVNTPTESLIGFARTNMDVLVVEDLMIERVLT